MESVFTQDLLCISSLFFIHQLSSWISLSSNMCLSVFVVVILIWFWWRRVHGCCILWTSFMFETICLFYLLLLCIYLVFMHALDVYIIVRLCFLCIFKFLVCFPIASVTECYCRIIWDQYEYFPLMVICFSFRCLRNYLCLSTGNTTKGLFPSQLWAFPVKVPGIYATFQFSDYKLCFISENVSSLH